MKAAEARVNAGDGEEKDTDLSGYQWPVAYYRLSLSSFHVSNIDNKTHIKTSCRNTRCFDDSQS